MSNNRNQPQFPDRMRIDSPEIQSINQTTLRISNWLHNDFVEVIKPLQVLPSLPGILEDFKNRLVDQFRIHFSGQVAVQMKAREVNIKVAERKHHFLEGQVDRRRDLLQQQTERIETRYNNMAEQTANEHSSFLRQLDQHVYQITDDIYPGEIQEKFSLISQPFWYELARRAGESSIARSICLNEGYQDARAALETFLLARQEAYDQEAALDSGLPAGSYEIPYWYAVVEDLETGEQTTELVFPWDLEGQRGDAPPSEPALRSLALASVQSGDTATISADAAEETGTLAQDEFGMPPQLVAQFHADFTPNQEAGENR